MLIILAIETPITRLTKDSIHTNGLRKNDISLRGQEEVFN
jgi:hypothetical protein